MSVLDGLLISALLGSVLVVAGAYVLTADDANGWWARTISHGSAVFVGLICSLVAVLYSPPWLGIGAVVLVLAHGVAVRLCSDRCTREVADEFGESPERVQM